MFNNYEFEGHALHYIDGKVHRATPAFDNVSMGTPDTKYRHFTAFSKEHSAVNGELADRQQRDWLFLKAV